MKAGLKQPHIWVEDLDVTTISGTTLQGTTISGTTVHGATISGTSVHAVNSVHTEDAAFVCGSPYGYGITYNNLVAEAVISGGMWVVGSEGVAKPAPASTQRPLGVAKATVASGATCEVLVFGPQYMIAEGTVGAGTTVAMGAGGGLNCVVANGAGSAAIATVITGASSGTTSKALIFIR